MFQFLVIMKQVITCCPHLVNRRHDAHSIFLSLSKCDEDCLCGGRTEKHIHILFVCKGGGSHGATERALRGL